MKGKKFYVSISALVLMIIFSFSVFSLYYVYDYDYWKIVCQNIVWYKSPFSESSGRFDSKTVYNGDYGFFIYQDMHTGSDTIADYTADELNAMVTNDMKSSDLQVELPNGKIANTYRYYDIPLNILDNKGQTVDVLLTFLAPNVTSVECLDGEYVFFPTGYSFFNNTSFIVHAVDSNGNATLLEAGDSYYTTDVYSFHFNYLDSPSADQSAVDLNISLNRAKDIASIRITLLSYSSITYSTASFGKFTATSHINPWQKLLLRSDSIKLGDETSTTDPDVINGIEDINKRFDELYEIDDTHKQILSDQKSEMDKIDNDLGNIGDALDSITAPSYQEIVKDIDDIIIGNYDEDVVKTLFSSTFSSKIVFSMISLVFIFSMMSYVLYGKKG